MENQAAEEAAQNSEDSQYTPVVIRRKVFPAEVMSIDDAVDRMELVGHPFYLFIDEANGSHSVVYRRHQYQYGVLTLDPSLNEDDELPTEVRGYRDSEVSTDA